VAYEYGPYVTMSGKRIPSSVSCRVTTRPNQTWQAQYAIHTVEFGTAKTGPVAKWFLPGYAILDERLDQPVRFEYSELLRLNNGSTELSAAKLLQFSKQKLYRLPPGIRRRAEHSSLAWPIILFITLGGIVVTGAVLRLMKRR
jgi:hypothetical protein